MATNKYWIKSPYRVKEAFEPKFKESDLEILNHYDVKKDGNKFIIECSKSEFQIVNNALKNIGPETYEIQVRNNDETA